MITPKVWQIMVKGNDALLQDLQDETKQVEEVREVRQKTPTIVISAKKYVVKKTYTGVANSMREALKWAKVCIKKDHIKDAEIIGIIRLGNLDFPPSN